MVDIDINLILQAEKDNGKLNKTIVSLIKRIYICLPGQIVLILKGSYRIFIGHNIIDLYALYRLSKCYII